MAEAKAPRTEADEPANVQAHASVAADAAVGRTATRLGVEYVLRSAQLMSQAAGGDLITGFVYHAIVSGNVAHLDQDPKTAGAYSGVDDVPPDHVRRPVSVLAVAGSLGLPYETTRRHVGKLVKAGLCVRVRGGLLVPAAGVQGPGEDSAMLANVGNLRRLGRGLRRAGFAFDGG